MVAEQVGLVPTFAAAAAAVAACSHRLSLLALLLPHLRPSCSRSCSPCRQHACGGHRLPPGRWLHGSPSAPPLPRCRWCSCCWSPRRQSARRHRGGAAQSEDRRHRAHAVKPGPQDHGRPRSERQQRCATPAACMAAAPCGSAAGVGLCRPRPGCLVLRPACCAGVLCTCLHFCQHLLPLPSRVTAAVVGIESPSRRHAQVAGCTRLPCSGRTGRRGPGAPPRRAAGTAPAWPQPPPLWLPQWLLVLQHPIPPGTAALLDRRSAEVCAVRRCRPSLPALILSGASGRGLFRMPLHLCMACGASLFLSKQPIGWWIAGHGSLAAGRGTAAAVAAAGPDGVPPARAAAWVPAGRPRHSRLCCAHMRPCVLGRPHRPWAARCKGVHPAVRRELP